jgi:hypothetical protein
MDDFDEDDEDEDEDDDEVSDSKNTLRTHHRWCPSSLKSHLSHYECRFTLFQDELSWSRSSSSAQRDSLRHGFERQDSYDSAFKSRTRSKRQEKRERYHTQGNGKKEYREAIRQK